MKRVLFYQIKTPILSFLKDLNPEFELERPQGPGGNKTKFQDVVLSPQISQATVINNEHSMATSESLIFYLRGIFKNEDEFAFAREKFSSELAGCTFIEMDKRLEKVLKGLSNENKSSLQWRVCSSFFKHLAAVHENSRAYTSAGRLNPNAVFWPDPTDPRNGRSLYTELPFAKKIPLIDKGTAIVSAGSCFATEIAHSLQNNGYNYLVKESNKCIDGKFEYMGSGSDLPNSSAAWGIIFNTPSFRQLIEKAFEVRQTPKILWTMEMNGKLRYMDPFRENISFSSPEAFESNYNNHIKAARDAFCEMEVFIITLGLNEVWYFNADSSVFSRSPWRVAPSLVTHRVLTVEENVQDLIRMTEIIRAHNPQCKIIVTLSPVGLHATFRGDSEHVVTANTHSKAVLRVAAEEFARRCPMVYYFPSYEVVTTMTKEPWAADERHVSRLAIDNVMTLFHRMFAKDGNF